ncbi:ABC transporter ATP-binding protein [Streptosporangium carneum]|uniref:ABC transporter ATP-binding protein n=1 Tax=Streptosporangium carneum TaxID=47481 RepID=UPI0022F337E4|nr:ABC transporter ATP-binding protein [Streptosporangium carneum]
MLSIENLSHSTVNAEIFTSLSLHVRRGESVVLCGPSGTGKTTLLTCVLGLTRPDTGHIYVAGKNITDMSSRQLALYRRKHVGMVFQFGELLPELSPPENVALAALLAGVDRKTAYDSAERLLSELGVPLGQTPTAYLSGGERQRTAVARALITNPPLLLADEPTGALDRNTRDSVADLIFELPRKQNCALLVVTHDESLARRADRRFDLVAGRLIGAKP